MSAVSTAALGRLGLELQRARRSTGDGWLRSLAIAAMTVNTWMALLVVGGTWMFKERADAHVYDPFPDSPVELGAIYVALAFIACVFVVPAMVSVVAQSAVLGAAGRERRLATLRLIGLSSGDVARMALVETAVQTVVGLVLGTILSLATAPFWAVVSFQGTYIGPTELMLPWWGYPIVWAVILVLALGASLVGLSRVVVSPLGVSRRVMPKSLRWWRFFVFAALVVGGSVAIRILSPGGGNGAGDGTVTGALIGIGVVMLVMIGGINVVSPLILQVIARASTPLPGAATFVATRRVATGAKAAWRRVAAMTLLSVLLGYTVVMPEFKDDTFGDPVVMNDLVTGMILTFAIGLVVVVVSTLLTQAATVYADAELTRALDHMGAPRTLHGRVAVKQTLYPLLVTTVPAMAMGALLGLMIYTADRMASVFTVRSLILLAVYVASVAVIVGATAAVEPLRRSLLGRSVRRND